MTKDTSKQGKRCKVLIIESGKGAGGSAFSMFRIVKYLDKTRYEPHVFVYYRTPVFADIEATGVPVTVLPVYSLLKELPDSRSPLRKLRNYFAVYGFLLTETLLNGWRLARYIRRHEIDIVHCNNGFFENFAAAFAARVTGTPCISHVRGTEPLARIEKLCSGWIREFIVLNEEMYELYAESFGSNKVRLIYNGVDLDEFENADADKIRREFGIDSDKFCIGTFARLVEGKGIPEFLGAAAILLPRHSELLFFIAGGGSDGDQSYVEELRAMAADLELGDRVIFAGWRDDVRDCMAAMDLIAQVSTTFPEGMSLAPIEGMTLAKPVIVTDNPGYANIVDPGKTGYIVPAGDVDALARRIEEIATDPELTRELGQQARQRVLEQFEYRIVVKRVQQVYADVLTGRS